MGSKVVNPELGRRIRTARLAVRMSQPELAMKCGLGQSAIAEIEAGRVRRPKRLREIARALRVSEEWLLDERPAEAAQKATALDLVKAPVIGIVETGAFFEPRADESLRKNDGLLLEGLAEVDSKFTPADGLLLQGLADVDSKFTPARARLVSFIVADEDLESHGILKGDVVSAVRFNESDLPLRDEMIVVLSRTKDRKTTELSLRRVRTFRDRIEFHSLQKPPSHRGPVITPREIEKTGTSKDGDGYITEVVAIASRLIRFMGA
jgi:transcriptional regulator with XRE-family HTH domain